MRLFIEHAFPRRIRYAKLYLEVGNASMFLSLDGTTASWFATIGAKRKNTHISDKEYSRYRANVPAEALLDVDGERIILRNVAGFEEEWIRPMWILTALRRGRKRKVSS